jgi:O-antigen ligase
MFFYYLLLLVDRFHEYPRLGGPLVEIGPIVVTVVKIVGLLAVVSSFLLRRPAEAAPRTHSVITGLFYAFCGYSVVGTLAFEGAPPGTSLSSLISFALLLIATRRALCTEERAKKAVRMLVVAAALSTLWVYKQHLSGEERAFGVGGDPNYEALELIIVVPLALWMSRWEPSILWRTFGAGAALTLTLATVLTQSRGALLVIPIIGLAEMVRARGKPGVRIGLVLAFGILVALAPSSVWQRFRDTKLSGMAQNGDQSSTLIRKELLVAGWNMIKMHPAFGVGLDSYSELIDVYDPKLLTEFKVTKGVSCNTYLELAAEAGIPTAILFLAIMASGYANCRSVNKLARGSAIGEMGSAMALSILSYAVASLFLTAWVLGAYWFIIFASANLRELAMSQAEPFAANRLQFGLAPDPIHMTARVAGSKAILADYA